MKRTTLTLSKVKKRGKRKNERIYVNYFKSTTTSNKLKWKLFQLLHINFVTFNTNARNVFSVCQAKFLIMTSAKYLTNRDGP